MGCSIRQAVRMWGLLCRCCVLKGAGVQGRKGSWVSQAHDRLLRGVRYGSLAKVTCAAAALPRVLELMWDLSVCSRRVRRRGDNL